MAKLLKNYDSIESELDDQTLFVEQQNLSYRLWVLLTFIVVLITFKKMSGISPEGSPVDKIITGVLFLSIIAFIYTLNKPSGFASFGLAIILLMIYKMKSGDSSGSGSATV